MLLDDDNLSVSDNGERKQLVQKAPIYYHINPENPMSLMNLLYNQTGVRNGELAAIKPVDLLNNDFIRIQRQEIKYHDDNGKLIREVINGIKSKVRMRDTKLNKKALEILDYDSK